MTKNREIRTEKYKGFEYRVTDQEYKFKEGMMKLWQEAHEAYKNKELSEAEFEDIQKMIHRVVVWK